MRRRDGPSARPSPVATTARRSRRAAMKSSHTTAGSASRGSDASDVVKRLDRSRARSGSGLEHGACLGLRRQRASLLDQHREALRQATLDDREMLDVFRGRPASRLTTRAAPVGWNVVVGGAQCLGLRVDVVDEFSDSWVHACRFASHFSQSSLSRSLRGIAATEGKASRGLSLKRARISTDISIRGIRMSIREFPRLLFVPAELDGIARHSATDKIHLVVLSRWRRRNPLPRHS